MRLPMTNSDFKKYRIKLGLTQSDLGEQLGLSERQIRRLEQDHPIQKQTVLAMMQLLWCNEFR